MDVLPAHPTRDSFRDSFKGIVALEIILDFPFGFPIINIISQLGFGLPYQKIGPPSQKMVSKIGLPYQK